MSPGRAAELAESIAANLRSSALTEDFGDTLDGLILALLGDGPRPEVPYWIPDVLARELTIFAQDLACVRLWRRHKTIYTIDSDLAVELPDTAPEHLLPGSGDLLKQLPHPNPLLILPWPIVIPTAEGPESVRYEAVYLYGIPASRSYFGLTNDAETAQLGMMFMGRTLDETGREVRVGGTTDHTISRVSLPIEVMSMEDIITDVHRRLSPNIMDRVMPSVDTMVPQLLRPVIPMIIYLCAANAERRTAPSVATRRQGQKRKGKAARVVEHGYHLGPQLAAARRLAEVSAPSSPTGRRMRPHVRRAHWHTYRTGKGRVDTVVHWLPPTPINAHGDADKPTVVQVTKEA